MSLRALQDRVAGVEERLHSLEQPVDADGDDDACDEYDYAEINGLFHRVHQLEGDVGFIRKMTDYAVDMSECTQEIFEKSSIRNGGRINRVADWVRAEFQRRLRRSSLLNARPRFPKGTQKKNRTRKGSKEAEEAYCPGAPADPAFLERFQEQPVPPSDISEIGLPDAPTGQATMPHGLRELLSGTAMESDGDPTGPTSQPSIVSRVPVAFIPRHLPPAEVSRQLASIQRFLDGDAQGPPSVAR